MNLSLNHNLTDRCIADVLSVISKHCMPKKFKKMSLYHFQKFFQIEPLSMVKNYYCSQCHQSIDDDANEKLCQECNNASEMKKFITPSIIDQLKVIMCKKNFVQMISNRDKSNCEKDGSCISELYDGCLYNSDTVQTFISNPHNITLTWCTDGVPVFKSSKQSMWPFYLRINELPYNIRIQRENTILAGLYFLNVKGFQNKLHFLSRGTIIFLYI